jgi:hypothetical protein
VGSSGIDSAGIDAADFLARYDLTSHVWSAVGAPGPTVSAINNRVRGVYAEGSNIYVVGDFTDVAGIEQADKVAVWDGAKWQGFASDGHGGGFFGEAQAVSLYSVLSVDDHVYVGGNFLNAGGKPLVDVVAGFRGNGWVNVGTNADGTNGPGGGTVFALAASRNKLHVGTLDAAFGGSPLNGHAASFKIHQPDAIIAVGQGEPVGNNRYNTTGAGQTKSVKTARGATATFRIDMQNDGLWFEYVTPQGPGSGGGFTVHYFYSDGTDITDGVVGGFGSFPYDPGARQTLILKVTVGNGVHSGVARSWLVTLSANGASPPVKDAVKATVTAK